MPTTTLEAVDAIALGFEIIDCVYTDWKFQPADLVAGYGLHAALIVGQPTSIATGDIPALAEALSQFTVKLSKDGTLIEEGSGKNALRSPAFGPAELVSAVAAAGKPARINSPARVIVRERDPLHPLLFGEPSDGLMVSLMQRRRTEATMRKFCAVACGALAILATTAADAQQVATSFAQLQVLLKAGDTVYITEDRGQPEWQAKIVDVTASSLVVSIDGVRRELSENNVQRIRRRLPDSRKNGALIGFLVGAAGSTAAAKGLESPPGSCAGGCLAGNVLYGGGVGALVGLGIDALTQGKKDIYLKNAATRASLPRPWRPVTGPAMSLDVRRVTTPPVPEHMLVSADAGYPSDDFDGLQEKLKSGDSIVVSSDDGTRIKGRLVAVSSDRITLSTDKGTRDIAAERVTRVQLRRNGVMLGAVIGTAIGIPFGIALKSYANNEGGSEAGALAFPIAVGAGAGLGIDALLVRPRTVFERHALSHGGLSFGATHQRASVRYTIAF